MAETKRIYVVYDHRDKGKPKLYSVDASCTAKQCRLARDSEAFDFHRTKPISEVHFSPESAIAAWRSQCLMRRIAAEAALAKAQRIESATIDMGDHDQ